MWQLRIAIHCNLKPPDRDASAYVQVEQPISSRLITFSLLIRYVTRWP